MDRISRLPNEIICYIVSFVSAKEAAFTMVLSKRFQNLYNIIPNLEFTDEAKKQGRSFTDFLDGVLALPASFRIRKISLKGWRIVEPAHYAHFNRCLCDVLKRGVLDLELDTYFPELYSLPFEVYTCKTLVRLKLGMDFVVDVLLENACLPALEILIINSVWFKDLRGCAFGKLLAACSVLKELIVGDMDWGICNWSGNVSSPTLERLTIRHGEVDQIDSKKITLDTPSLTYLYLSEAVPDDYQTVNLYSLVEANLDLMLTVDHIYEAFVTDHVTISSNPTILIKGLRNVEIMNLASYDTFQGPLHYDEQQLESVCKCMLGYSFLLSCPLKVLQINEYNVTAGEVGQLKHFLEKLSGLKLVEVHARVRTDKEKLQIATDLLMIPRASENCKIQATFP